MCLCFVWARGFCPSFLCAMYSHVNLSWPHPSCYLFIDNFPQLLLPRYPPHLLPYNLLVFAVPCGFVAICRFIVVCLVSSPALRPVLPCVQSCLVSSPALCPVQPCVQSSLVSSPASLPVCFFPYGVVFVCLFYFGVKLILFPPAIGSSLSSITGTWHTPDGFGEHKDTSTPMC